MKQQDAPQHYQLKARLLINNMVTGAIIALIIIGVFLFTADGANPEWGRYWQVKPMIIVPVAGAMGGAFFYYMNYLSIKGGWKRVVAVIIGLIGYVIALWLGSVLGLDGTYWN